MKSMNHNSIHPHHIDPTFYSDLCKWYRANARDLPWRRDRDPYHVWISEIMLQQTRVETVTAYYLRFLAALPDIPALAAVPQEVLLKLWEGLGYYSRARNLKKAAQVILDTMHHKFPRTLADIQSLPGIGPYTAGAIASICFNQPTPAVDGNVLRVCARLCEINDDLRDPGVKKTVGKLLKPLYPDAKAIHSAGDECGTFTQAFMELGATVCIPGGAPLCERCPVTAHCAAHRNGSQAKYPVISPKQKRRIETRTVFLLYAGDFLALSQRPDKGLLSGLWELPNTGGILTPQEAVTYLEHLGATPLEFLKSTQRKHIFTHLEWHMTAYFITCAHQTGPWQWVSPAALEQAYALPTAFRQFLEDAPSAEKKE